MDNLEPLVIVSKLNIEEMIWEESKSVELSIAQKQHPFSFIIIAHGNVETWKKFNEFLGQNNIEAIAIILRDKIKLCFKSEEYAVLARLKFV